MLLTDLYEITMAYGYWKLGLAERRAVFHHFYREQPFGSGFAVAAGLGSLIEFLDDFGFTTADVDYLATLKNVAGEPLFEEGFLDYLRELQFACDIDAIVEGTFVFPQEPIVRVRGPLLQAQMLETIILNLINYQTLIATKAARLRIVCGDDEIMEFGLRRAQGKDGGMAASRAAYVGGCDGVSNVEAGRVYDIPVKGTMAHSWVMVFNDELGAFKKWAEVMPDNVVLLVDTYDSVQGVRNAVEVGQQLAARGKRLLGVRLDSGDLLGLSLETRRVLDAAGLTETRIVASNELDEYRIRELKAQGAPITCWGVGTRLVTGHDQLALGGVYKLGVVQTETGEWSHRMKFAGVMEKSSEPGILQVRRFCDAKGTPIGDVIYDTLLDGQSVNEAVGKDEQRCDFGSYQGEDLLLPIYRKGERVYQLPSLRMARERTFQQLAAFPPALRDFDQPADYFVGMEQQLDQQKRELMQEAHARSIARGYSK
jgi:nicotinate phosphoribosyltransferase